MKSRAVVLAASLLAFSGCIFSPDDDEPGSPVDPWKPEFYAALDSVYAWFPFEWPDTTTFTWNLRDACEQEYVMDASVEVASQSAHPVSAHLVFLTRSDGTGPRTGTFRELAQQATGYMWSQDAITGEMLGRSYPFGTIRVLEGGVEVRAWNPWAEWVYGNRPDRGHWDATFTRRGFFQPKTVTRPARYVDDLVQERARVVRGALTPDDYVIMDVVARDYVRGIISEPVVIVSPTQTYRFSNEENNLAVLRADPETVAAFAMARTRAVDADGMDQIGYTVADVNDIPPGEHVRFSGIGYNRERTQAILYGSYYCGNLCAEGEIILLRKLHGYWVIQSRIGLWIS